MPALLAGFDASAFDASAFDGSGAAAALPADLAAAIYARFRSRPPALAGVTDLYVDEAGGQATLPYAVVLVPIGTTYSISSDSHWRDVRVSFKFFAATREQAAALRDAAIPYFEGVAYPYEGGFSIPFFEANRSEGKGSARGRGNSLTFRAQVDFSARCRREA